MIQDFFKKEFLEQLPPDSDEAIVQISTHYSRMLITLGNGPEHNQDFAEAYAILRAFDEVRGLNLGIPSFIPTDINRQSVGSFLGVQRKNALDRLSKRKLTNHFQSKEDEYRNFFSGEAVYTFGPDKFSKITELINEIRKEIEDSSLITPAHKRRLSKRLEAMEKELKQECSDIDRFWGFIAEAGIVARKFGEDLKPLNERVCELGKIVTCVIMSTEGIQALPEIVEILTLKQD